jgi:glycosyltransferase involved in cell wall biosynthesis
VDDALFTVMWLTEGNAYRKCAAELVRAVALIRQTRPNVRLSIAGQLGSAVPSLKALITELDLEESVELLGAIPRAEKIRRLQTCAVYLQPSRYEGFGMAILEAMACGAAVVTSPVGEVPFVAGDSVQMVEGTQPFEIADAAISLLENIALREALGQRAVERARERFAPSVRRQAIAALIESALADH